MKKKAKKPEKPAKPKALRKPEEEIEIQLRLPMHLASDLAEIAVRSGTTTENVVRVMLGLSTFAQSRR